MSASCFESSCGVKKRIHGNDLRAGRHHGHQRDVHLDRVRHHQHAAFAAAETALRKIPREAADRAAELGICEAPVLVDHGRDVRVTVDGREQHVHEALVARQVPIDVALPADV